MSPMLKAPILAILAALLAATGAQAGPDPTAVSTAKILANATEGENGNDDGLARWGKVCPSLSGLNREQGEQMLERLSAIAQDAGVPLAGETCSPTNLYILFTSDPKHLLRAMEKRNRAFTFSCGVREPGTDTSPSKVDDFINTQRVVRAWYNTTITKYYGNGETLCSDRRYRERDDDPSRLQRINHYNLLTTFVVIDTTRLAGITQDQLAGYIAMVSLVRMNPDVPLGNAETILRLFEVPPGSAPAGLTVWDRALIKAVYAGNQESKHQRMQLVERMIAEVQRR